MPYKVIPRRPTQWTHQEYEQNLLGPLDDVVQQLERTGVVVSVTRFNEIAGEAKVYAEARGESLRTWVGHDINWNSPQQTRRFLHEELGLAYSPYYKKGEVPEGKVSDDDRALEWLQDHFPEYRPQLQLLREYKRALRMQRYAVKWAAMARDRGDGTATLHPSYGLASDSDDRPGAKTGRFAVKNPALNQVPSDPDKDVFGLRTAFVAPPGHLVIACDASQLEVVLISHKATLLFGTEILRNKLLAGGDLHIQTARGIYGRLLGDKLCLETSDDDYKLIPHTKHRRSMSKNLRYGMHYLKSGRGFGSSLFDEKGDAIGEEEGEKLVQLMYQEDPELYYLMQWGRYWVRKHGYTSSLFGRWTKLEGWDSQRVGEFNRARRREANWMAQAGGQEILALALIGISQDPRLKVLGFVLRLPVHDEIVGTCPEANAKEAAEYVKEHITKSVELLAPLQASGGPGINWAVAK